jgi:hypothetical protein
MWWVRSHVRDLPRRTPPATRSELLLLSPLPSSVLRVSVARPLVYILLHLLPYLLPSFSQQIVAMAAPAGKLDDSKVASPQPAEEEKTTAAAAAAAAAATVPTGGDDSEAGVPPNPFDFSAMTGLLNVMLLQSFLFPT